jgi:dTDP-4-dehydrorhamnose 3,5-epimerase
VTFQETALPGVFMVVPQRHEDERGFFADVWCRETFGARGLCTAWAHASVSYNRVRGTLRGLHYQAAPYGEAKLVRCTAGAIYDVVVDLRPDSPAYRRWSAVELTADGGVSLYISEGLAHGFLTLTDGTEVSYLLSAPYRPETGRGVRWNDPAFAIAWPGEIRVIAARDRGYPDFLAADPGPIA